MSIFFDNDILLSNYGLFRKDRPSCDGRVLIAVNNKFTITSPDDLEISIRIKLMSPSPVNFLCSYIPPSQLY